MNEFGIVLSHNMFKYVYYEWNETHCLCLAHTVGTWHVTCIRKLLFLLALRQTDILSVSIQYTFSMTWNWRHEMTIKDNGRQSLLEIYDHGLSALPALCAYFEVGPTSSDAGLLTTHHNTMDAPPKLPPWQNWLSRDYDKRNKRAVR